MADHDSTLPSALSGQYRVDHEIGAGGMATVYLAYDLKHDRRVALKVLRPELAAAVGGDRFLREIKLTAGLQHPHILPLYDSGAADGSVYYVMPYVEGESLRTRLDRVKQLPIREALDIACAVASALEYAHRRNIVHRDIKPENILLSTDEQKGAIGLQALVADFGVAVAMESAGIARLTSTGVSVGTPAYMSPEQAGAERSLGPASDVYALGVVLYEMLTGEPPFTGPTAQAVVARVMSEPPIGLRLRRPTVPLAVDAAVTKALAKVPADRFATAAQFAEALRAEEPPAAAVTRGPRNRMTALPWAIAAVLATALIIQAARRPQADEASPVRSILLPPPAGEFSDRRDFGALSRDGQRFAFVVQSARGPSRIWVQNPSDLRAEPVAGTEGASAPFWSSDGRFIAFFARGQLLKVTAAGGTPMRVSDAQADASGTWGPDGAIYFSSPEGILRVGGGETGRGQPQLVFRSDSGRILSRPSMGSERRHMLLTSGFDEMLLGDTRTGLLTKMKDGASDAQFVGENAVAYVAPGGALFLQHIDLAAARMVGEPIEIGGPVRSAAGLRSFTTSATGTVAYLVGRPIPPPVIVGRNGVEIDTIKQSGFFAGVGHRPGSLALGGAALYRYDVSRRTWTQLHHTPGSDVLALDWSPDDARLAFSVWCSLMVIDRDGGGLRHIVESPECLRVTDWFDIDRVIVTKIVGGSSAMWEYRVSDGVGSRLGTSGSNETDGTVAPNGSLLAYASDVGGTFDVYVRPLHGTGAGERISLDGGRAPRWRADGRELFFVTPDGDVMAAAFTPGSAASIGQPKRLFRAIEWERSFFTAPFRTYDVSPDGERFYLMRKRVEGHAVLIRNALSELRRHTARRK